VLKEEQKLALQISEYLKKKRQKIATAESCTGGYIAHELTNIQGSSEWFVGGVVSYTFESKITVLGVDQKTLQTEGAVQKKVALSMAKGVKSLLKTDWSLSITGYLDTGPERGRIYVGVVGEGKSEKSPEVQFTSTTVVKGLNREILKYHSLLFSLKFLISKLDSKRRYL